LVTENPGKLDVKPKISNGHVVAEIIEKASKKKEEEGKIKESDFQRWNWRSYFFPLGVSPHLSVPVPICANAFFAFAVEMSLVRFRPSRRPTDSLSRIRQNQVRRSHLRT